MFQIDKVFGFELSVLYSYPMRSAFVFVFVLKCGKMWHSDSISSVSDPNPSLILTGNQLLSPWCFWWSKWVWNYCGQAQRNMSLSRTVSDRFTSMTPWLFTTSAAACTSPPKNRTSPLHGYSCANHVLDPKPFLAFHVREPNGSRKKERKRKDAEPTGQWERRESQLPWVFFLHGVVSWDLPCLMICLVMSNRTSWSP